MNKKLLFVLIIIVFTGTLVAQSGGRWNIVTKMPYPVSGGQAVLYKDKIYILGGYSDSLQSSVDWIQEYDVSLNKWKFVGTMLQPRDLFVAAVWDSTLLFFGGVKQNSSQKENIISWNFKEGAQPSVFSMDPNFSRTLPTGHVKGNYLYIIGGNPLQPDKTLPYLVEYDLKAKGISYTLDTLYASVDKPQQHMTMIINNDLYILGGVFNGIMKSIRRFNIPAKKYEVMSDVLLEPRAGGAAIYNSVINQAFVLGGYNEANLALSTVEQISIKPGGSLSVLKVAPLNAARTNPMVVNYKNTIIVFGGKDKNQKVIPSVEIYVSDVVSVKEETIPTETKLFSNYPNPFNPSTKVGFQLAENSEITLDIYSILGEHIVTLKHGEFPRGYYEYEWNGKDKSGKLVSAGVYLLTLRTQNFVQTRKMLFLK